MTDDGPGPKHPLADKMALALDVDDLVAAQRSAAALQPYFGVAKVGLELFSAAGPDAIGMLQDLGYKVFLDGKFHDIPTTIGRSCRVLGAFGVSYLTLHARAGLPGLRAGVEGLQDGAADGGFPEPIAFAVTVLTSDADAPAHIVPERVRVAIEAGCGGLVCAGGDVRDAKQLAPRMQVVVPGIRPDGAPAHDQVRATTPADALAAGADLLVIGRAVTAADDPPAAMEALLAGAS